jgi:hypothetical protein
MDDNERKELVDGVQRQIAFLLADLEKRTGCYVDGLSIESIDVTRVSSDRQMLARAVRVDLRRAPGSEWMT